MITKKIMHGILGLAVLLQALFVQVALPNLVLCFGEDGHLAFEWREVQETCAHSSLVNIRVFDSETMHKKTHDVECSDLNLHMHPTYAFKVLKKKNNLLSAPAAALVFRAAVFEADKKRSVFDRQNNFLMPAPILQQNTVLII